MEDWEKNLIATEQRSKSNTHRIDDLEAEQEKMRQELHELTVTVTALAKSVEQYVNTRNQEVEQLRTGQKSQGERIGALEKQPAENWKLVVRTIITGIVGALAGGIAVIVMQNVK